MKVPMTLIKCDACGMQQHVLETEEVKGWVTINVMRNGVSGYFGDPYFAGEAPILLHFCNYNCASKYFGENK